MSSANSMRFPDDYITEFTENPNLPKAPLKIRFLNAISEIPAIDSLFRKRAKIILDKTKITEHINENGVYLDTGTGLGHFFDELSTRKNIRGIGVDPVFKPLRRVKKRLSKKNTPMTFFKTGGQNVPVHKNVVDGVFLFFVLHHIPYNIQKDIIQEMKRVLKKDGKLFLMEDVPANSHDWERIEKWDARNNFEGDKDDHYYRYDKEWETFFKQNRLTLIDNTPFESESFKKGEGIIPHRCYVLKKNKA